MTTTILVAGNNADVEELFRAAGRVSRASLDVFDKGAEATRTPPDVLIVDLRGRARLPAWVAEWKRSHGATPVVLVASGADPALMLSAMRSGISECLVEPLTRADAQAAIARVTTGGMTALGQVFAFIGAKGGVGTTTVAVNVAAALRRAAGGTLLVDLNIAGGDAALMLGAEPRFSIVDALANTHRADEALFRGFLTETPCGLPLLAAPAAAFGAAVDPGRLRALIEFVRHRYRYTVLDVPRAGAGALDALHAAGMVVIVANQEVATLRSAALLAAAARTLDGVESVGAVLNRYDDRTPLDKTEIEETVGLRIIAQLPSSYRLVVDAANRGEPLAMMSNDLSRSFGRFARELARLPLETQSRGGSVLTRFGASISAALGGGA